MVAIKNIYDEYLLLGMPIGLIYCIRAQKSLVKPNLKPKNKNSSNELIRFVKGNREVSIAISTYDTVKAKKIMEQIYKWQTKNVSSSCHQYNRGKV